MPDAFDGAAAVSNLVGNVGSSVEVCECLAKKRQLSNGGL